MSEAKKFRIEEDLFGGLDKVLKLKEMNEYERGALKCLMVYGKMDASTLAKKSEIPQPKIYSTIDMLVKKEMVYCTDDNRRPKIFAAIRPEIIISRCMKEYNDIFEYKDEFQHRLIEMYEGGMESNGTSDIQSSIRAHNSYTGAISNIHKIIKNSSKEILAVGGDFSWLTDNENTEIQKIVNKSLSNNISIRFITNRRELNESCVKILKEFQTKGIEINETRSITTPFIVVDKREVLFALKNGSTKSTDMGYTFVELINEGLAKDMIYYFNCIWNDSTKWKYDKKSKEE